MGKYGDRFAKWRRCWGIHLVNVVVAMVVVVMLVVVAMVVVVMLVVFLVVMVFDNTQICVVCSVYMFRDVLHVFMQEQRKQQGMLMCCVCIQHINMPLCMCV